VSRRLVAAAIAAVAAVAAASPRAAQAPATITASGTAFHVDGRPAFLLGVSLFDALGTTPPRDADLDALARWGVRIARVWAHWEESIYQGDGALTPPGRARLLALVERLRARGMILELVLLKPGQMPGQGTPIFQTEAERERAVKEMTTALRDYRNIIFDLFNEHDHPGGPISHATARVLRDAVKAIDPARLVTISSTGGHLVSAQSVVGPGEERNLREEAGTGPEAVGVDIVAPHFPRTDDWAAATTVRLAAVRKVLDTIGRPLPIYLNEERRTDPRTALDPAAYQDAFNRARQGGAASWLFHTAAGFKLARQPFLDALAPNERAALSRLAPGPTP
jgi:Cellulase (glycosyl hydrolase family 5)